MAKLPTYFFCSLILLNFQGQLAETLENGTVCVLQNAPLQCGTFCLSALHPIFDVIPKVRGQMDRIEKEQQALRMSVKEDLEAFQAKINTQLEKVRSEMNGQLQAILGKIEGLQAAPQQTHPTNISAANPIVKEIPDKTPINPTSRNQLQAILGKIEGLQAAPQQTHPTNNSPANPIVEEIPDKTPMIPTSRNQNIPAQFEQIGSRFFYIEHETKVTWLKAESTCREKGGYLATIIDWREFYDIKKKLKKDHNYWLGINDLLKEGNYVSIASGKEAMYFKWARNNPEMRGRKDYVFIRNGYMYTNFEFFPSHFICQADSET